MADDNHSSYGGRRKPQFRGPFVVTNPNNDSDDENVDRSHYISPYVPPPLPSTNPSTTHSPYPQQPQPIGTQGGSSSNKNSYEHIHVVAPPNGSNPSLSSPSGSSSPNVESTPPPSTPGLSTQYPTVAADDAMSTTDRFTGPMLDSRNDVRQYDAGARMTMMDKFKQHLPAPLRRNVVGTRVMPSPIVTNNVSTQNVINGKVLLTVTADCENFTYLDISGSRNAAMIREKIYSRLQITDDQQPFFSIFRTEIGSFATSEPLSDDMLMKICIEEGDPKGTVKFLAQHSSAPLHLPQAPSRNLIANHVPPVLPYQENFRSPSRKARSIKSNHETTSSTSEPFVMDPVSAGYEASNSADDVDTYERDRNRQTIRPPYPPRYMSGNPPSPRDHRRSNLAGAREQSPANSRKAMSPSRHHLYLDTNMSPNPPTSSLLSTDRLRSHAVTRISPDGTYLDDNAITPPSRPKHAHSNSDAAATERERSLEMSERILQDRAERQLQERESRINLREGRDGRVQEATKRRAKIPDLPDTSSRVQEPWVLVPSPQKNSDRPSTADANRSPSTTRPSQHTPSASHSGAYSSNSTAKYPYSPSINVSSRPNFSQIPAVPRGPPPQVPVPPAPSRKGQQVPPNWFPRSKFNGDEPKIKYLGDEPQKAPRSLLGAKSMDNLRGMFSSGASSSSQKKPNPNNMLRPSMIGLKEAATGSFMNLDPSPSRREPSTAGLARSFEPRSNFSPTSYTPSRSSPMASSQSQGDLMQPVQPQYRPLPVQGQSSTSSSSALLNAPSSQNNWRYSPEDPYPRPHSAFGTAPDNDIGASPAPPRSFRPLPSTNTGSWVDVEAVLEDSRSPRVASPHHPYAAAQSTGMRVLSSGKNATTSSLTLAESMAAESHSNLGEFANTRSPRALPSPDSPRSIPVNKKEMSLSAPAMADAPKSFGPLTDDSPVYDGDIEGGASTLKSEDQAWVSSLLSRNTSSSEGTLKAGVAGQRSQLDKPLPNPHAAESSTYLQRDFSSLYDASRNTFASDAGDIYGSDEDEDSDDDDGGGTGLWKQPPKKELESTLDGKRPELSVNTDGNKESGASRGPYVPPYPPPNFPPPSYPPPSARRPKRVSGKGERGAKGEHRRSRFYKDNTVTWAFRPPAEVMYDRLEEYFPDHDLDKPLIESTSGGSSPTAVEPAIPAFQGSSADKDRKFRHKKSIRIVAEEHKRKIDHTDSSPANSMLRKRSTKLWGSKVEEVTTSQIPNIPTLPESPTAANPKPIFKWVRGELIGKGTYGRVYLALNATTGEMIAVKQVEIPKTDADRDDKRQVSLVEALKLESETLKDLDHPHIVQYLGFEETPDFLSIFLEYVPGGSVAGCLRKHGKFEDQITRSFTGQILSGLEYLHQNSIIHRDLKADNILVDPSGICKISDFGISKRTDDINENGIHTSMQGSVFWMAPEVVQAARKGEQHGYNGKVDIWSLGCVVLEMWAGRRPWQDADAFAVIFELITKQGAPPVPPDVTLSPEADDFRQKCFAIRPDERPSASELRQHRYLTLSPNWSFQGFK